MLPLRLPRPIHLSQERLRPPSPLRYKRKMTFLKKVRNNLQSNLKLLQNLPMTLVKMTMKLSSRKMHQLNWLRIIHLQKYLPTIELLTHLQEPVPESSTHEIQGTSEPPTVEDSAIEQSEHTASPETAEEPKEEVSSEEHPIDVTHEHDNQATTAETHEVPFQEVDESTNIAEGKDDVDSFSPATEDHTVAPEEEAIPIPDKEVAEKENFEVSEPTDLAEQEPIETGKLSGYLLC